MIFLVTFWDLFILFFIFIPLILFWTFALVDLFRRADMTGVAIVVWLIIIIILPIVGPVTYLLLRPSSANIRYKGETVE
jgi:hypothetical protein